MEQNCGTCKHSYLNEPAVLSRLGCWKDKEASGFQYTFNLAHDGKGCNKYEAKNEKSNKAPA